MNSRTLARSLIEYLKSVVLITIIVSVILAVICFMANWNSIESYSKGLMYSGTIFMIIGILSIKDIIEFTDTNSLGQLEEIDILDHIELNFKDNIDSLNKDFDFFIIMNVIGICLLILSLIFSRLYII